MSCISCWPWSYKRGFNTLPNDKILDLSNLKAFADDKINMTKSLKFVLKAFADNKINATRNKNVLGIVENLAGKEESAHDQHVLHFTILGSKIKCALCFRRFSIALYA